MGLGMTELILIVGILLIAFGSKALPMITKNLGKNVHDLKKDIGKEIMHNETGFLKKEIDDIRDKVETDPSKIGQKPDNHNQS